MAHKSMTTREHLHYRQACTRPSPSQIRLAGMVVAAAFGDIRKLWPQSLSAQPTNTEAKAGTTVSRSTRQSTEDGHPGSSNLPLSPEQKIIKRSEALNFYSLRVVSRDSKYISVSHAAPGRRAGARCKISRAPVH